MSLPFVTIAMPSHNEERYIEALGSTDASLTAACAMATGGNAFLVGMSVFASSGDAPRVFL